MSVKRFSFMTDLPLRHDEYVLASDYSALEAKYKSAVEALTRVSLAKVDGLDGARDSMVLERAIKLARRELNDHAASKESP
jgi:hypothetical protein